MPNSSPPAYSGGYYAATSCAFICIHETYSSTLPTKSMASKRLLCLVNYMGLHRVSAACFRLWTAPNRSWPCTKASDSKCSPAVLAFSRLGGSCTCLGHPRTASYPMHPTHSRACFDNVAPCLMAFSHCNAACRMRLPPTLWLSPTGLIEPVF